MTQVTADDVDRYQRSGMFHEFTCQRCRGVRPDCPRKGLNRLLGRRDEHILEARTEAGLVMLVCNCCAHIQLLDEMMTEMVAYVRDAPSV